MDRAPGAHESVLQIPVARSASVCCGRSRIDQFGSSNPAGGWSPLARGATSFPNQKGQSSLVNTRPAPLVKAWAASTRLLYSATSPMAYSHFGRSGHRACANERQVSCGQRTSGPIWRRASASRSGELTHPTRRPKVLASKEGILNGIRHSRMRWRTRTRDGYDQRIAW